MIRLYKVKKGKPEFTGKYAAFDGRIFKSIQEGIEYEHKKYALCNGKKEYQLYIINVDMLDICCSDFETFKEETTLVVNFIPSKEYEDCEAIVSLMGLYEGWIYFIKEKGEQNKPFDSGTFSPDNMQDLFKYYIPEYEGEK